MQARVVPQVRQSSLEILQLKCPSRSLSERPTLSVSKCIRKSNYKQYICRTCRPFHTSVRRCAPTSSTTSYNHGLETFKKTLRYPKSTLRVRDIPSKLEGENKVVLHGYLGVRSDLSKTLSFVSLKDVETEDRVQIMSAPVSFPSDHHEVLKSIKPFEPVAIVGKLQARPTKKIITSTVAPDKPSKDVEVLLEEIHRLNDLDASLVLKEGAEYSLEQRNLRLRTDPELRATLRLRDRMTRICHSALTQSAMIETPLLFKSTSEGANEFIVPTRRNGFAYALPQSPQQFKQVLMASGIHRYYQFARCFRDEDLRNDRQPEFTQLDFEMAFATSQDIKHIVYHKVLRRIMSETLLVDLPRQAPEMTYQSAMQDFGSDKPDLRIPFKIRPSVESLLPGDFIRKIASSEDPIIDALMFPFIAPPDQVQAFVNGFLGSQDGSKFTENPDGGPGVLIYDSSKPLQGLSALGFEGVTAFEQKFGEMKDGHLIVFQARKREPFSGGSTELGNMRLALHAAAVQAELLPRIPWKYFEPIWIIDFPLFSPAKADEPSQGGRSGLASTHHPFTSPKTAEDVNLLLTDPSKAIGDHFDLVINGEEIGGGSRRIHIASVQEFIFREVLQMDESKIKEFAPLIDALKAACPPHSGIALGFDRLVAMVQSHRRKQKVSIRDTIAFPKSGSGEDPMWKSPGTLTDEQLQRYHLQIRD